MCYRGAMQDQKAQLAQLQRQLETLRFGLDSLGAAGRLTQRGKIEDTERQIRVLLDPPALDQPAAKVI
jgi:hypothetical protein